MLRRKICSTVYIYLVRRGFDSFEVQVTRKIQPIIMRKSKGVNMMRKRCTSSRTLYYMTVRTASKEFHEAIRQPRKNQ